MGITKSVFGVTKDGKQVDAFLIENNNNMKINLITWGATLQSILVKDKDENEIDLLLGFDDMKALKTVTIIRVLSLVLLLTESQRVGSQLMVKKFL